MAKKKYLTADPLSGKLSRINPKDLKLINAKGLNDGDPIALYGTLTTDIIEYCVYDNSDNYLGSGELLYPFDDELDVGGHVRGLGYNRGTYKIVYNFLRRVGGSNNVVLTKRVDKSIWKGAYYIDTDGKVYAGTMDEPLLDENDEQIELIIQDDKYWLQEVSPSRTELRLRPNPGINDLDYHEQFRLLGYTCLAYSDISGESYIIISDPATSVEQGKSEKINETSFDNRATLVGNNIKLDEAMIGGNLIVRDAFIIDTEETPEVISKYNPIIETDQLSISENLVDNGAFESQKLAGKLIHPESDTNYQLADFWNPGNSKYVLRTKGQAVPDGVNRNSYTIDINGAEGETYVLSCWVWYNDQWPEHEKELFITDQSDSAEVTGISETKEVNGRTWERHYTRVTPTSADGNFKWFLGKTDTVEAGPNARRYITNIQCEPGSLTSLPTPYINKPRTEEIEVTTTGKITFKNDGSSEYVETIIPDEDEGFTDNMVGGKLTIKDAVISDEIVRESTERIALENIPVDNTDAFNIRDNGNEGEFHKSPFHGVTDAESNELKVSLQAKDEYWLYHNTTMIGQYEIPEEVREIDDLTITNRTGMTIRDNGNEGEFHYTRSPFHNFHQISETEQPKNTLKFTLQVDWQFTLIHIKGPNSLEGEGTEYVIRDNWRSNWQSSTTYELTPSVSSGDSRYVDVADNDNRSIYGFEHGDTLRLNAYNIGAKAGFLGKIEHDLFSKTVYRTGDSKKNYAQGGSGTVNRYNGIWNLTEVSHGGTANDWKIWHDYKYDEKKEKVNKENSFWESKYITPELLSSKWIWARTQANSQLTVWEWTNEDIGAAIFKYPDPILHADAISVEGWSNGDMSWEWGQPETQVFYKTRWAGYHAKWTRGEGRSGGNTIKFIDQNSQFQNPNHTGYTGVGFDENGNQLTDTSRVYSARNNPGLSGDSWQTLEHRAMIVEQYLPVTLATQGIQPGDILKVSWWQKTDTPGKGARVMLSGWRKDLPSPEGSWYSYGENGLRNTTHNWGPGSNFGPEFIPIDKEGVWTKAEFTAVVPEAWDLTKMYHPAYYDADRNIGTQLRVYGNYGPEGIVWVEDIKISFVNSDQPEEVTHIYTVPNFEPSDKLRVNVKNSTGESFGFVSKIEYKGGEYKTGDPYEDYYPDPVTGETKVVNLPGTWKIDGGGALKNNGKPTDADNVLPDLKKSEWLWDADDSVEKSFIWSAIDGIENYIWHYPDPKLRTDAIWPTNWNNGFYNWDLTDNTDRFYHSGWIGHHAKWVDGDGRDGDACMKFIDQNSKFISSNDLTYTGLYGTGLSDDEEISLVHRPMWLYQKLPHTLEDRGIQVGDQLTISWRQKSDTIGKGAAVGLLHRSLDGGQMGFGDDIGINHPAQTDDWLELTDKQWFRYKPVSQEGEWEDVSFDITVDENTIDLEGDSILYVYGQYGPEGILWVEGLQISRTSDIITNSTTPIFSDFVGYIQSVDEKNKLTLTDTYDNFVTTNLYKDNNELNLRSWSTFDNFYVDYTSSLATSTPVYGSLRGEIHGIENNTIILSEGFRSLGEDAGHDFEKNPDGSMLPLDRWFIQYPKDRSEPYSKLLKYGPNEFSLITNFKIDRESYTDYPYSVVYKLYEPLPDAVQEKDFITIVREMAPPLEEVLTLYPFVEEWVSDTVLRTPSFTGTKTTIGEGKTEFKTYDELVSTDVALKEGVENEILSGSLSADINVDHSQFSNFVHFGSVEKRIRNFKYKLELIEQYTDRSASLAGAGSSSAGYLSVVADPNKGSYLNVSGSSGYNPAFTPVSGSLTQVQSWEQKRRDTINSFDKFEKYMFYESSSYLSESIGISYDNSWPKREGAGTYISPYLNYRTTQSVATTWFDNQITSASAYDRENKNRVRSHLPVFVQDDDQNAVFLNFIDMIGHYFDGIWIYIKALTDIHDKRDKLTDGIAKDLLKPIAQSLGWEVHDGKDLVSLKRYIYGMEQSGSETPWQHSITPDRDISREIWSRVINNMPYFLKTKGTTRAIKGLISCYGIPSSILRVMEYGGPALPGVPLDTFLTRKFTKALNFYGASNNTYVQNNTWKTHLSGSSATSRVPDTVEFRFRAASGSNQVLVRRGDDWGIRLKDNSSVDNYGYVSFMLSGSKGYNEVTSSELPVYDGEFWSVMLTRTSASGHTLVTDSTSQNMAYNLHVKKYDAGRSKLIYESSNTLAVSGALGATSQSYNLAYSGSDKTVTIGGPQSTYFGESFSGSMMEYRNWTQPLNTASFDNHVAAPIAFDGNSPSASYLDLITRYSFDDDKDLSVGANNWFRDVSADQSFTSSAIPSGYTSGLASGTDSPTHFSRVVDETKMKVPNLGPSRMSSNKIRIEADSLIDPELRQNPILDFGKSITIPAYDTAPIDSNKLGIFFSPSKAIDEDIILSMPNLDFDQYIGDPRDQYKEQYSGLVEARNLYWKKYSGPNNFWDYLRLLKYYDSSLYEQVRSLIPARANATVGILVEPTILERD